MSMAIIENMQREDLNPLEEAAALKRLVEEFGLTHEQVGEAVGRSRTAVSNMIRLLELEEGVRRLLEAGDLPMGHARALLTLPAAAQAELAREIVARGLSVRQAEELARKRREAADAKEPARPVSPKAANGGHPDPDVRRLEQRLIDTLGARVSLKTKPDGKGSVTIHYNSLEELDGILSHIH